MKKKTLAIITARGGSKRIPGKNIKEFCGRPIISYSIEAALQSGVFDEVMVSTDDEAIAQVAVKAGAVIPFMRSADTAGDYTSTDEVIKEVLHEYLGMGQEFAAFCCIYPTAPFISPARLREAMKILEQADSVMPVTPFSFPPQRGLLIREGEIRRQYPEYQFTRSQDLDTVYHDCGQFYACRTNAFLEQGTIDVDNQIPLLLSNLEVQDIDTFEDWEMAELKYKILKSKK